VRFLLDNTLSPKIVEMLCSIGADAVHLRSLFPAGVDDTDWIARVATEGLIVLTLDHAIRTRPHEREAWRSSRGRIFFLPKGVITMKLSEQASWIMGAWEGIEQTAAAAQPGQCFLIQQNKRIQRIT
jgi:hypothetical protein